MRLVFIFNFVNAENVSSQYTTKANYLHNMLNTHYVIH